MTREGRKPSVDLVGQKFGQLVATRRVIVTKESGRKEGVWLCLCDCGKETHVRCSALLNGNTKSCGCYRGRPLESGRSARNSVLYRYKENARKANREWGLSDALFDGLTSADCHYCGNPPTNNHKLCTGFGEFRYNGIDRKDSRLGYTPDNVVPCCKVCQKAKSNLPYEVFTSLLIRGGGHLTKYSTI
jgi:hypothetical protein